MVDRLRAVAICAVLAVASGPAQADEGDVERLAREGAEKFVEALETLIQRLPRYDLPELTEDGDIIIRRREPDGVPAPRPSDPDDQRLERI